ncbi:MAG TPA: bifunctional riboflavin kinase/FAD synthetase [Terriglobales bacterium]|jgi:riboflavin kinase/FMN adenylyltransferase|nr:bifunctional riboflavin kinase/FAD synthetase [Terriglobales bacterium]
MQIVRHTDTHALMLGRSVVTMGNFDGIHLGHQALICGAVNDARRLQVPSVVLTFEPHPLRVLAPDRAPKMLLSHKDKMELLRALSVDIVVIQNFDLQFANIVAEDFVRGVLLELLKVKKIWVGRDLRFGRERKGTVDHLIHWGVDLEFDVGVVEPILVDGARVSSSRIRQLVVEGRVDAAKALLGRYHFVSGRVISGHRRGRELGFPTANIASRTEVLPADGIYATLFHLGERTLHSVSSVGLNPTFGAGPRTVESYILDFDEDIYGASVKLAFVKRIRDERKFASIEELITQIRGDVISAQTVFAGAERAG